MRRWIQIELMDEQMAAKQMEENVDGHERAEWTEDDMLSCGLQRSWMETMEGG